MSDRIASHAGPDISAMLSSIVFSVVQLLILGSFDTQLCDKLAQARAPGEVIAQVRTCASSAMPILVQRVSDDLRWGISVVAAIWLKGTRPEHVVADASPSCGPAIEAARSYLREKAA